MRNKTSVLSLGTLLEPSQILKLLRCQRMVSNSMDTSNLASGNNHNLDALITTFIIEPM